MLLVPAAPPQAVPMLSGFDYVTVDAARRRVYAAHTGSRALLIVDADSGKVLGQVRVGPLHGVAVDPATGHVFTGDGDGRTVSEVDPQTRSVLASVDVDGPVDAIAYDAGLRRIYADEDNGNRVFVIDAKTMREIGTVKLPGHKPEYLAIDPKKHDVYQNIADLGEIAVIDPRTLEIARTISTPEINGNHPLQLDAARGRLWVGGENGVLAAYDLQGHLVAKAAIQARVDQCDLDVATHDIACAGGGEVTIVHDPGNGSPAVSAKASVARGVHTLAFDEKSGHVWIVWADTGGDYVQSLALLP